MDQVLKFLAEYWHIIVVLAGLAVIYIFQNGRQKDVQYAKLALTVVRRMLGAKLGPKADLVFAVLLEALDQAAKDGLSGTELVDAIVVYVKDNVFKKSSVELGDADLAVVREAAEFTAQTINVSPRRRL